MDVSVIIITKNQLSFLQQSLPVLLHQKYSGTYEIIIVDSGSTDGALQYCRSLPVKLVKIPPANFNFAHAFNAGAQKARGKYLIRLSGDAIPVGRDFIHHLTQPFKDQHIGAVYGQYLVTDHQHHEFPFPWQQSDFPRRPVRYHFRPHWGLGIISSFTNFSRTYALAGGSCAIRRSLWRTRPFNESIPVNEDAEYAWFLHAIGYDILYTPQAKVLHQHLKIKSSLKFKNLLKCWLIAVKAYFQIIHFWTSGKYQLFSPHLLPLRLSS